jgi:alkylation response protein AidB-like acyl-CoA dehydrogenase
MEFAFDERLSRLRALGREAGLEHAAPSVPIRDRAGAWNPHLFVELARAGVARAATPERHGGLGLGVLESAALFEGLGEGSGDAGLCLGIAAHAILCAVPIARLGTDAQRDRYLPRMSSGRWLAALALTELDGGATADGFEVTAATTADGWVLDGEKADVINAPEAQCFLVTAFTADRRRTAFLIDRDTPGFWVHPDYDRAAARTCRTGRIQFIGCRLPSKAALGAPGRAGSELIPLLAALDRTCALAPWLGLLQRVARHSRERAAERRVFGRPLTASQEVRATLVDGQTLVEAASGLLYRAAWQLDQPEAARREDAAAAKLFLSSALTRVSRTAVELAGAAADDDLVRRVHRDAPVLAACGGGTHVLHRVIADSTPLAEAAPTDKE